MVVLAAATTLGSVLVVTCSNNVMISKIRQQFC
nr:MAG TPA: hypothetical protein [Caudoviricetes sp.]